MIKPKVATPSSTDVKLPIVILMLPTPPNSMAKRTAVRYMETVLTITKVNQA